MTRHPYPWAFTAVLFGAALVVAAERDADERTLRNARIGTDGPALLQFFRTRTVSTADRDRIAALIKQLGDDSFEERERASADLVAVGGRAESQLRDAAQHHPDPEIQRRAEECLKRLATQSDPTLLAAAARVLAARKPAGAAKVLLAYLPQAPSEFVADEVRTALAAVAVSDGKADPALVKALDDKLALRRAAAAVALCQAGVRDQLPAVRKLLRDAEGSVRLRVALALAFAREKDAVPALIDLLAELPQSQSYEADDVLRTLAGDAAPETAPGKTEAERKKCRDAWAAWWKKNGDKVDLTKLADGVTLGLTLIVERDVSSTSGRVLEVGRDGKVLWKIDGLRTPVDAQVLPGGRVLIAEYSSRRLVERTIKGETVWEKTLPAAATAGLLLGAQRLANSNTFIITRGGLLEIDRDGKELWSATPGGSAIYAARKTRTGEVVYVTLAGLCVRLDATGKEESRFTVGRIQVYSGIDLLPNGNVLVPHYAQGRVIEYDAKGKAVWDVSVSRPNSAVRLPNGHTLVGSILGRRVVELDRDGKEVWKYETEGTVYKAYRR